MTNFNETHFGSHFIDTDQYAHLEKVYQQLTYAVPPTYSVPYGFSTFPATPQMQSTKHLLEAPFPNTSQSPMQNVGKSSTSSNTPESTLQVNNDHYSDEDMSDEEPDLRSVNPYFGIVNSALPTKKPPNWRALVLFGGRINPEEFPKECPKPQSKDGSLLPQVRKLVLDSVNADGTLRKFDGKFTMQYPGGVREKFESRAENHGFLSANGRTWFRKKPADSPATPNTPSVTLTPPTTRKRFANQSLVIAGGKRIYTDNSNECIAYAHSKKCVANNLCNYDHDGKSDHQALKFCRDQMLGTCRNGSNCSKGAHSLSAHQLPVCHYFLRMSCVYDNCPYLHIKHQSTLENCQMFQKGVCLSGLKCPKPHRYNQRVLSTKCNQDLVAKSSMQNDGSRIAANEKPEPIKEEDDDSELPTWHF